MARSHRKYAPDIYTPVLLNPTVSAITPEQVKQEYTRLRRIALKRIARLKADGVYYTKYIKSVERKLKPASDIKDYYHLAQSLLQLDWFLTSRYSSLREQRKISRKIAKKLQAHGYDVKEKDLQKFGDFMEFVRTVTDEAVYDSESAANFYENNAGVTLQTLKRRWKNANQSKPDGAKTALSASTARKAFSGMARNRKV